MPHFMLVHKSVSSSPPTRETNLRGLPDERLAGCARLASHG